MPPAITIVPITAPLATTLVPYSVDAVRESFHKPSAVGQSLFITALILLGCLMLMGVAQGARKRLEHWAAIRRAPERLFKTLLARLPLDRQEQRLLSRMAHGARLRHPTMCLLSPSLMEWTLSVWQEEAGQQGLPAQHQKRIHRIIERLYGQQSSPAE